MNQFEAGFKAGVICWIMVTITYATIKKMIDQEFGPDDADHK